VQATVQHDDADYNKTIKAIYNLPYTVTAVIAGALKLFNISFGSFLENFQVCFSFADNLVIQLSLIMCMYLSQAVSWELSSLIRLVISSACDQTALRLRSCAATSSR